MNQDRLTTACAMSSTCIYRGVEIVSQFGHFSQPIFITAPHILCIQLSFNLQDILELSDNVQITGYFYTPVYIVVYLSA